LIKWKGSDEETWEPEENLCDSAFEKAKRLWNEVDGSVVCVDSENGYCTDASEVRWQLLHQLHREELWLKILVCFALAIQC
jgi:hypothetical protein